MPGFGKQYSDQDIWSLVAYIRTLQNGTQTPVSLVMGRLMQYKVAADPNVGLALQPTTGVATSVESPDAITWTVKLRSDVKWHNVAPVNGRHPNSTTIAVADYDKLVSLLGTAFDGTAQQGSTLPIYYTEFGVESQIPAPKASL